MLIPLIPKDPERNDFTCRDGEIDFIVRCYGATASQPSVSAPEGATMHETLLSSLRKANPTLAPLGVLTDGCEAVPPYTIRVALQSGDKPKAELMLSGEVSRVDPATAERLTQAMVEKAAEALLDISTDLRRQGLFILPFRYYTVVQLPDGTLSYPSAQGVALPTDYPPHPEITAASVTDDCLTLALRFPVKPHRLTWEGGWKTSPTGCLLRTFISYPLYIPDPKEMRGSIGSVRSLNGGNATGIRFAFLSTSALKASVAAPEKYYELVGNERTGYRFSSKASAAPDYRCYADVYGYVPVFPREGMLALGDGVSADTDPLDWIADWVAYGGSASQPTEGYLPVALPHRYWQPSGSGSSETAWPEGIDKDFVLGLAESVGEGVSILLTRPMTFASDAASRRHATARGIRTLRVLGLPPGEAALAVLYGSDDGVRWTPMRRFDPRVRTFVLTPRRLFWRLLIVGSGHFEGSAVGLVMEGGHSDRRAVGAT